MELNLATGGKSVSVSDEIFARPFNKDLVHQIVTAYLAGSRAGTKAQKNRAAVRGGGKKPWRQKGTGRARAGTIRSPIWAGGGVTFAAVPRDYSQKVNRKMYRAGMRAIVSELLRQDRLVVIEAPALEARSTKALIKALDDQNCAPRGLMVVGEVDDKLGYSANNIVGLDVVGVSALDPVVLVGAEKVLITEEALRALEGWLQ
ncbi:50S ribosomal protein L4 [Endozoicomonas sp. G2_2]|uniref:50S ribosomal protein L4 n=1 Tax=Endozoicomonas sp. G2_2 TaxID=2821092 RepID=UPI001ADD07A9|nr:50S ribosomal protein L4 [Endozoicomonas sp. G2_2]MBO9469423.1 50S ribosomal protein L4 [Endozoicomonas sp. G2_2]|tara:strand:+ start:60 stop:668 length:609 start_codon:yes stop_codon:yes gene_type:complete